jgi:hypothetical protein
MRLEILHVDDCPNVAVLEDHLRTVVGDRVDVEVTMRLVEDDGLGAELGMRGSPTLLVDGIDPFADLEQPPSVSCRLYHGAAGAVTGAPSLEALRHALAGATERQNS